jgi:hypothetical protein
MALKEPTARYSPGSIPSVEGLPEFLQDELWRIATAISAFPVTLNIEQVGLIVPITPVPVTFRLFIGALPISEVPGGGWDSALGEWINPVNGIYNMSVNTNIEPFGQGNKIYESEVSIWADDNINPPREVWRTYANAPDDQFLSATISLSGPLVDQSKLWAELTVFDDQFSGDIIVNSYMSIVSTTKTS